jgi:hypothetical protein
MKRLDELMNEHRAAIRSHQEALEKLERFYELLEIEKAPMLLTYGHNWSAPLRVLKEYAEKTETPDLTSLSPNTRHLSMSKLLRIRRFFPHRLWLPRIRHLPMSK